MRKMPPRNLFGEAELDAVREVFEHAWEQGRDFGYQGDFEKAYADDFCAFMGGGYADAVCTGTVSILVGLAALDLPKGSEVLVSPVTDPGGVTPALFLGHSLTLADAEPGTFNVGPEEFEAALTPNTKGALITHLGGFPARMEEIMEIARARGVKVLEDCSQAHGASYRGRKVGSFGDISAFSTMFSKNHASGGCGGLVYAKEESGYRRIRSIADRGKDFFAEDFNPKDPARSLFAGLNFNQNEVACAIGRSTLKRLPVIIEQRQHVADMLAEGLATVPGLRAHLPVDGGVPSYFFLTVVVDEAALGMTKFQYTDALAERGIWLNPDYRFTLQDWPWLADSISGNDKTPNAAAFRAGSFNLLFHENFSKDDVDYIVDTLRQVQKELAG
ncbi:DegT/DnrJ/EryC1/StrS family aminotransferase [Pseudodesulfovibrio sp.]|uniref:DegT/DnrJ/EryC1/StrS family aminotransferase n=1 Tax=unclassified Pseudodesulfovibrio TaxID=2661612 RepID=UPI003B006EFF